MILNFIDTVYDLKYVKNKLQLKLKNNFYFIPTSFSNYSLKVKDLEN